MSTRILALATNPIEGASTRYRILAYTPFLEKEHFLVDFHPFFPSDALSTVYGRGKVLAKMYHLLRGFWQRSKLLQPGKYDLIVIHREIFPLALPVFSRRLKKLGARIIYDYDDAMFLPQRQHRWVLGKLERPDSVKRIMAVSDAVIAGNSFLADYAQRYNKRVVVIPTLVDVGQFKPANHVGLDNGCTIGWIGSHTTAQYLDQLGNVFIRLARSHRFQVKIVGAGQRISFGPITVQHRPWELAREAEEFRSCDIGVYPLWTDEWARGKCGFKALQFMASGVPVVASSVGANLEIIQDGVNGFLAATEEEWISKLARLIENPVLRREIGLAGRRTVEERYSLDLAVPKLLEVIRIVLGDRSRGISS